jgi:crotonobetainyl-CoA:carnitine CoA-transferase CaiB-like acyl-CoA transferase
MFPTADGWLFVMCVMPKFWVALCEALGLPELVDDPRFGRNEDRTANREELRPLLVERLKTRGRMEWFEELLADGIACGPINTVEEGIAFAERVGLDPVVVVGEGSAAVPGIRNPITFSATPARYDLPPPGLDEHGTELRAWLAAPREPATEDRSTA